MNEQEIRATMLQAILAQGISLAQAIEVAEAAVSYVLNGKTHVAPPVVHQRRRDCILDLWSQGKQAKAIAAEAGTTRNYISYTLARARREGDPRAVVRRHLSAEQREAVSHQMRAANEARVRAANAAKVAS